MKRCIIFVLMFGVLVGCENKVSSLPPATIQQKDVPTPITPESKQQQIGENLETDTLMRETKIAFVSTRDGNEEIYVMNADGSNQKNLTNNPHFDFSPNWSPDGKKIVFVTNREGKGNIEIYEMDPDGNNQKALTHHPLICDMFPSWSPDGKKIAFERSSPLNKSNNDSDEIYIINTDGHQQEQLTHHIGGDGHPGWSPDSKKIAYHSHIETDIKLQICIIDLTEKNILQLTKVRAENAYPSWSPDGKKIVFESKRDGNSEIYVMNADGSNQKNLTQNPAVDFAPSWSPDSKKICFVSNRDGNSEIYVMDFDGSNVKRLTYNPTPDTFPCWSPILKKNDLPSPEKDILAFVDDGFVCISKLDGSSRKKLVSGETPSWSPDGSVIAYSKDNGGIATFNILTEITKTLSDFGRRPKWSFDGKYLLFESDSWFWVVSADGGEPQKIDKHIGLGCSPQWFPDNRRILYVSGSAESPEIKSISREGGAFKTLGAGLTAALSPDGLHVAIVGKLLPLKDGSRQLLMLALKNLADEDTRVIYTEPTTFEWEFFHSPLWSPSGKMFILPWAKVIRERPDLHKTVVDVLLLRSPEYAPEMIFEALKFTTAIHGAEHSGIPYHVYGAAWAPSEEQIVLATIEPLFLPEEKAFLIPGLLALRPHKDEKLNKGLDSDQLVIVKLGSGKPKLKRIGGGHCPTVKGGVSWSFY